MGEILEQSTTRIEHKKPKRLMVVFLSIICLMVIAGGIIGWLKYQEKQKEKYAKSLAETSVDMYMEFLLSSLIVSSYSDVWSKAIDNGADFSIKVANFQDSISEKGLISDRKNGREKIRNKMKLLQNPPTDYRESYNILKKMYATYTQMVDQSISPTGSLIEFNRKTDDLSSQFEQQKEEFTITLPADVKKIKSNIEKSKKKNAKL